MKMKKEVGAGVFVLLVMVVVLILASFLSLSGIFDSISRSLGITGMPVIDPNELPEYPTIDTHFSQIEAGQYTFSWEIEENDPRWDAEILWSNLNISEPGFDGAISTCLEDETYTVLDTPPIFKFLNLNLNIKHGNLSGNCRPRCKPDSAIIPGGPGKWIDYCITVLALSDYCLYSPLQLKNVSDCPLVYTNPVYTGPDIFENLSEYFTVDSPYCCFEGAPEEGWYTTNCTYIYSYCSVIGPGCVLDFLIRHDQCELGEYSVFYKMQSDNLTIFEQELKAPGEGAGQNTSINWFTHFNFVETNIPESIDISSGELLDKFDELDYVSKWNSTNQKYSGSAKGTLGAQTVVIGSFAMDKGKPYFASVADLPEGQQFFLSYAGEIPAPAAYQFKKVGSFSNNYVSLTLDTNITNASQLCNIRDGGGNLILDQTRRLAWWNPVTQTVEQSDDECSVILTYPDLDFVLSPGKVYQFIAQRNATWAEV